jgi:hypothetical protein
MGSGICSALWLLSILAVYLANVQAQFFPGPGPGPGDPGFPGGDSWTNTWTQAVTITIPAPPPVPTPPTVPTPPPVQPPGDVQVTTVTFVEPPHLASTSTLTIQVATGTSIPPTGNPTSPASPSNAQPAVDIRIPSTAKQCEPFHIHYNLTSESDAYALFLGTPDGQRFLSIRFPSGVGCMEWVCNVPAGHSFYVSGPLSGYYIVQPGSSSTCLHNITTTYTYAQYNTNIFQSFTAHPPNTTPPPSNFHARFVQPFSLSWSIR